MPENKVTVVAKPTASTVVDLAVRPSQAMARSTIQRWETLKPANVRAQARRLRKSALDPELFRAFFATMTDPASLGVYLSPSFARLEL
jgi:hypothetical protein